MENQKYSAAESHKFSGGIGVASAPRQFASPIEEAHGALKLACAFSARVQELVDRAVGPAPEPGVARGEAITGVARGEAITGGGVLPGLGASAQSTQDAISAGMRALLRLEQALS